MKLLNVITKLFKTLAGLGFYISLVAVRGFSRANGILLRCAQSDDRSIARSLAAWLLDGPLATAFSRNEFYKVNRTRDRLTSGAVEYYSDDSLLGYGDITYTKGGDSLETQQRGLILKALEAAVAADAKKGPVLELGTANGDILAHLRTKFAGRSFIGVDFSIKNAELKHGGEPGIKFVKGYALDLLESGSIHASVAFCSSTMALFAPEELRRYIKALKAAGAATIVLSEPSWGGYTQSPDGPAISRYLDGACWYHNYAGYLREAGYRIEAFDDFRHMHPRSDNPDLRMTIVTARA